MDIEHVNGALGDLVRPLTANVMNIHVFGSYPPIKIAMRAQFAELAWNAMLQRLKIAELVLDLESIQLVQNSATFSRAYGENMDPLG